MVCIHSTVHEYVFIQRRRSLCLPSLESSMGFFNMSHLVESWRLHWPKCTLFYMWSSCIVAGVLVSGGRRSFPM